MNTETPLSFKVSRESYGLIEQIAERALPIFGSKVDLIMTLCACHANGCLLDLQGLRTSDEHVFIHDVGGILDFLDPDTGKLTNCFRPRFAM